MASNPAYARAPSPGVATGELPIGSTLGRYVVRGTLGVGGMGVVHRAVDVESGAEVALKTLHEWDPVALYRLKREFRTLADVSHRNLVSLGALATEDGRPFFTMELVDGIHFHRWLEAGPSRTDPMYFERLRYGLRQIAIGLRALHGAGKVHCDLKSNNVLVTRDDRIVIVDFGLVRERAMVAQENSGRLCGTALYMAPEQARTPLVGPAADWYSFGIMLYRALTGVFPFHGSQTEILLAKQEREPPPASTIARGVPADLDKLCVALLRRAAATRPGSAEVLAGLGGADHEHTGALARDTSSVSLSSVFVGRRRELELLKRCLASSRGAHGAVLLSGASGVGKSSLVRHFLELVRVRRRDAIVLIGRCYRRDFMPYRALDSVIDSLSDYLSRLDQVALARLMPPDAALLGRVFPVLARVPAVARATPCPPQEQDDLQLRARVFAALRQLLAKLASSAPVIMLIDDLQWADADDLAALADVFRGPDAPHVLLVGTVRTGAGGALPYQLARLEHVVELRLAPLPARDAEELAEVLLDRLDPTLLESASAIARESRGHPLFIDELVRFRAGSRAAATERSTGLEDAIWRRFSALEVPGKRLITALAIAEVPLSVDAASLAMGASVELVEDLAGQLTREQLLRPAPAAAGGHTLELYHDRIREVVISRVDAKARTRWHRHLADALVQTGVSEQAPTQLLRHLTLSGQPLHAARLAVDAAERAIVSLAFDAAAELYRLAIEQVEHPREVVLSLRRGLAEALVNAGRGGEAATVLEQIAAAVDDTEARADCLRRAAEQLLLTGDLDRGLALLESVATECGVRVPPTNRSAMMSLAWRRLKLRIRGTRWRERNVADVPERAVLAQNVNHSFGMILALVDPVRGLALLSQATLLALRNGVRDRVMRALTTEAIVRAAVGDRARAMKLLKQGTRLAYDDDDPGAIAWVTGAAGIIAYSTGRFVDAIRTFDHALALHAALPREQRARVSTGGAYEASVLRQYRMFSLAQLGRCNELRREIYDLLHDARQRGDTFTAANAARGLNVVWLLDDHPERAREQLAADLWTPPKESFHMQHWLTLRSVVQTHLYCGTAAQARAELATELARSKRSAVLRLVPLRAEHLWLLGRIALAEAEAVGTNARARRARCRQALAEARRLDRLDLPQARTAASLLRAGVAFQRGNHDLSLDLLLRAEVTAHRSELRLMQAAARRRRGELVGGSAGDKLIAGVDDWATAEGIRRPDKFTRMYAPGFSPLRQRGRRTVENPDSGGFIHTGEATTQRND